MIRTRVRFIFFIMMLPVSSLLAHNFIPHHHHDYCLESKHVTTHCEHHDASHDGRAAQKSSHNDINDQHERECHIHHLFQTEKITIVAVFTKPIQIDRGQEIKIKQPVSWRSKRPDIAYCLNYGLRAPPSF